MPRFVLLYHACPPEYGPSHWDLMLESGGALRTWRLAQLPREWAAAQQGTAALCPDCPPLGATNSVAALQLPDHRSAYLEFEGPLTGNRGEVRRIDKGTFTAESESPECLEVTLVGREWRGPIRLRRCDPEGGEWRLTVSP